MTFKQYKLVPFHLYSHSLGVNAELGGSVIGYLDVVSESKECYNIYETGIQDCWIVTKVSMLLTAAKSPLFPSSLD
jgi:hypothetical protein